MRLSPGEYWPITEGNHIKELLKNGEKRQRTEKSYNTVLQAIQKWQKGVDSFLLAIEFCWYSRPTEIPYIRSTLCIFLTCSAVKVAIESFHLLWVLIKCTARRVILSQFGVACLSKGLCHFLEIRASTTYTAHCATGSCFLFSPI